MGVCVGEPGKCLVGDGLEKEEDRMSGKEGEGQYVGKEEKTRCRGIVRKGVAEGRKEAGCHGGKEPPYVYCAFPVDSDESLAAGTHESRSAESKSAAFPFMWDIQF